SAGGVEWSVLRLGSQHPAAKQPDEGRDTDPAEWEYRGGGEAGVAKETVKPRTGAWLRSMAFDVTPLLSMDYDDSGGSAEVLRPRYPVCWGLWPIVGKCERS